MKPLPSSFTKNGFHHALIERSGLLAIYRRWKRPENPHFEVIKIREGRAFEMDGKQLEAAEIYPDATKWGKSGWTFSGEDCQSRAFACFRDLLARTARQT